jgi:DNA-binding MarR family transcriptional regulator
MDIAKKLFMQRSYLCKLLSKLEECDFIVREKTIKGKRQSVIKVYATEKGKKMHSVMIKSFRSDVLQKPLIEQKKMLEMTDDLFAMADKIVDAFNLKL